VAEGDGRMAVGDPPSASAADRLRYAGNWHDAARVLGDRGPFAGACESARPSVELALKAVLVHRGAAQPSHNTSLLLLAREIGEDLPPELRSALVKLDHYWYYASYPSELIPQPCEYYEEPEASEAVAMARRLIDWACGHLPEHVIAAARWDNSTVEDP